MRKNKRTHFTILPNKEVRITNSKQPICDIPLTDILGFAKQIIQEKQKKKKASQRRKEKKYQAEKKAYHAEIRKKYRPGVIFPPFKRRK